MSKYLVLAGVFHQAVIALRVQIISPYPNPLLRRWQSEWPYSSHDVADCFSRIELGHQATVLGAQSSVPIHFRVIELEDTVLLPHLHIHVVRTRKHLVSKGPEFVVFADVVNFVDDGAYDWIFVHQNRSNERFVGKVLVAEIEMGLRCSVYRFVHRGEVKASYLRVPRR